MKKFAFALLAMASALAIAPAAMADTISISFTPSGGNNKTTPVTVNAGGISLTTGVSLEVFDTTDTGTGIVKNLSITGANVAISTGVSSSYGYFGPPIDKLIANYNGGVGKEVTVDSSSCQGGICLTGILNNGGYSAIKGSGGSFQGLFTVTYVNPWIDEVFGDSGYLANSGSDSFNTGENIFTVSKTGVPSADAAPLTSGTISFDTPVPEPSSLLLLGTGLLGLAFVAFRKAKPARPALHLSM
jgi:hypothetical protein